MTRALNFSKLQACYFNGVSEVMRHVKRREVEANWRKCHKGEGGEGGFKYLCCFNKC